MTGLRVRIVTKENYFFMLEKILGKDISRYVGEHRLLVTCAIILAAASALLAVVPVAMIKPFVDEGMKSNVEPTSFKILWIVKESGSFFSWKLKEKVLIENISPNSLLIIITVIAVVSVFLKSIATYFSDMSAAAFSNRAIMSLRIDLFRKFVSLHQAFYHKYKAGTLISRSTADLTVMQMTISNILIGLVQHPLTIIVFFIYLLKENYILTLLVLVVVPVIMGLIRLFGKKVKKHSIRVQDATADVTSAYQETLLCLKVIQGFCMADIQSQKFRDLVNYLYKKTMHYNRWLRGTGPMMDYTVFLILPAILIAGKIYFHHTLGELMSMLIAFSRIYSPIKKLAGINNDLRTLQGATERVFGIINTKPDIEDKEGALILPKHNKTIEFKNVCFSYKKENPILQNISFSVKAGEMVAFVGSTGAGKSTLMDLIPRFYDATEGQIMVDGIDIREATIESLRKQIGIVSQEVLLFHDTILNNIDCRSSNADMKAVIEAATAAHAHEFIMEQPNQYETIVGDRGSLLSGGQKQRISIARAILTKPSILILDEVASALDAESEELIQKSIDLLKGKCTIFVIAHRLSTIRNADRIYVLEKGRIIESGTHQELINRDGRFRQLYDMQFHV